MNRTYIRTGGIAVLAIILFVTPVCAQSGLLGHNPTYLALSQKAYTPDYLLVDDINVVVKTVD